MQNKAACQQAQAAGFVQSEEVGRPQLPVKVVLLGVPPDAELALDVNASPVRTIASGVTLCAAQPRQPADPAQAMQEAAPARDLEVFEVDQFYPGESVRLIDLGFMRSQRIVRLEFYPVQFNPVAGQIRVNDRLNVTVRFGQTRNSATTAASASTGPVTEPDEFETAYRDSLLNYDAAQAFRRARPPLRRRLRRQRPQLPPGRRPSPATRSSSARKGSTSSHATRWRPPACRSLRSTRAPADVQRGTGSRDSRHR